ncbi:hypothetical protein M6D81_30515 [Paenibacillus sp. J5C_2022]|nr:hypothetical protein [Paenibacillus sp. J5C2022]
MEVIVCQMQSLCFAHIKCGLNQVIGCLRIWIKPVRMLKTYTTRPTFISDKSIFTAKGQSGSLQPLQQVADTIASHLDAMNERLSANKRARPFEQPSSEQTFVSYPFLDTLFRVMKQSDYR